MEEEINNLKKIFPDIEIIKNSTLGINGKPIKARPFSYRISDLRPYIRIAYWESDN